MNNLALEIRSVLEKPKLKLFSLNSAAKEFGVSSKFLEKGIADGKLRYVKNGNRTYVTEDALKKFFESNGEYV